MQVQKKAAQQLRKSIYSDDHNPLHKKFILDSISEKVGKQNLAYILVTLGCILYPIGYLFTNQNNFNPFETSLLRGLVTIVINFFIARHYKIQIDYSDGYNLKILMIRNLIMAVQGVIFIIVQFYLTQPVVQTLGCSGTLFVFILDYFINGITISKKQVLGGILSIIGVLFTVNGQIILRLFYPDYTTTTQFKNYNTDNPTQKFIAALTFVLFQFVWAYAIIVTKNLRQVNSIQINFHLGLSIFFTSALIYPSQVSHPVDLVLFLKGILYSGLLMVIGQILFVGGITMTKNTGVLTMLSFVSVIVGYVVSIVKYKEEINPFCTLGTILIAFGLGKILLKSKQQKMIQEQKQQMIQMQKIKMQNLQKVK